MKHARSDYDRIQDPAGLIPEDEPVFLIRGQDICAPHVLEAYASIAFFAGASPELVEAVRRHAKAMRDWQTFCAQKVPDLGGPPMKDEELRAALARFRSQGEAR